jgi:signal transduction histidine kinase
MNSTRISYLTAGGLIALVIGLFAAVYSLNVRQYRTSIVNVENAVDKSLDQRKARALAYMERIEARDCGLFGTDQVLEAELFAVQDSTLIPACIANVTPLAISGPEADKAFKQGVALLPSADALPFFEKAASVTAENEAALYQKTSALFNILEFRSNPSLACRILVGLEQRQPALSDPQRAFFLSMLREQFPNLDYVGTRLSELQNTASFIRTNIQLGSAPFRAAVNEQIFAARKDGLALLYSPDFEAVGIGPVSQTPTGMYREIMPGLYVSAANEDLEQETQRIRQQFHRNNMVLSLLALLASFLGASLVLTFRKQRELNAARTQFIATVSHELRTPLSLIRLHAETLHHGRIPPEKVAEYHQTILTESERLSGIVNNVLDFSRMERGKMKLNLETVNLSDCTEQIIESFSSRFEREGFRVETCIEPDIISRTDPLAFSQIVFNLLDNAIKYSDGAKTIQIKLDVTTGWTILTVADQGIGIPDPLKKHIFDEFTRSDDSKVTARRGSGIGLNVAQRLAGKMGGNIEVTDNPPKGSVFTVRLKEHNETIGG